MTNFETVKTNLTARGYTVSCFETVTEATTYLSAQIDGTSVGFGGSVTLEELGLYEVLSTHNEVFWHQRIPAGKTSMEIRNAANAAEVYVSSVNAIAETGEIVNIDGVGNRLASILYGHKKVYLIAGVNKLAPDCDSALYRARNVAAPKNARRLCKKTPCAAEANRCYDCRSPERICRALSVLWEVPMSGEYELVLIDENLGY